jgi:hypothetical protein
MEGQILAGMSDGQIRVLYSPQASLNGAKLPMSKGPPKRVTIEDMTDAMAAPTIITPGAGGYGEGEMGGKRKREKDRNDPRKSRRPELPLTGPGKGGRVGASATQHVVQNLVRDTTRDEDVGVFFFLSVCYLAAEIETPERAALPTRCGGASSSCALFVPGTPFHSGSRQMVDDDHFY